MTGMLQINFSNNENNLINNIQFLSNNVIKLFKFDNNCLINCINYIFEQTNCKEIWVYNLTSYASLLLRNFQEIPNLTFTNVFQNHEIFLITVFYKKKKIKFKSLFKLLPVSLSELNVILKKDLKKEVNFNQLQICYLIHLNLLNLCRNFNINCLKNSYSASSLATNLFYLAFNKYNIKICNEIENDKLFRIGYFGGRCEVFGNAFKNEKIFQFDFSSMYGNIMKELLPLNNFYKKTNLTNIEEPGFYYVHVFSDINLPILPFHQKINNEKKLIFPNGYFSGLYWHEELKLFLEFGGKIQKIEYAYIFTEFKTIFKDYVDYFINYRTKSNLNKLCGKILINSLYGKLGMKIKKTETLIVSEEEKEKKMQNGKALKCLDLGQSLFLLEIEHEENNKFVNSLVYLAAVITSKARIKLYRALIDIINNKGRILYVDTDGIFAAYSKNVLGEKHGSVNWDYSLNWNEIVEAVFADSKCYAIKYNNKNVIKIKGVNSKNLQFFKFKELFYSNNSHEFIMQHFIKENLQNKEEKVKILIRFDNYKKRIFSENKSTTTSVII